MDLSIIIPCKNLENWITPLLDSLNEQETTMKMEIIFICDYCKDRTCEIIKEKIDSRFDTKVLIGNYCSCGYARKIGLDLAKGKYIWFLDGDDWLTYNHAIQDLYNEMVNNDLDIGEFRVKSKQNPEGVYGCATCWRAMLSKRIIGDTRFPHSNIGEDNVFSDIVWNKNGKYKKVDLAPYFYNHPRKGSNMDMLYHYFDKEE